MNYLHNLERNLYHICEECQNFETEKCKSKKCNIGFAKYVIQYTKESSLPVLEGGKALIPRDDLRYYDEGSIASGVANICKLCKECNENHNEDCIISLIRRSLESTQLKESITYPGNILSYIFDISKQSPKFAELVKEEYMKLA